MEQETDLSLKGDDGRWDNGKNFPYPVPPMEKTYNYSEDDCDSTSILSEATTYEVSDGTTGYKYSVENPCDCFEYLNIFIQPNSENPIIVESKYYEPTDSCNVISAIWEGDFNGDGFSDAIYLADSLNTTNLHIWLGKENGNWDYFRATDSAFDNDGDGSTDIFTRSGQYEYTDPIEVDTLNILNPPNLPIVNP